MRANASRKRTHEEEEESVFVSMTDMTVSFLFIVMVLLAFLPAATTIRILSRVMSMNRRYKSAIKPSWICVLRLRC